jgi:hypothetical protein
MIEWFGAMFKGHVPQRQVPGVRRRVIRTPGLVERKGRSAHPEGAEDFVPHDVVVGLADLSIRLNRARADVAGGRGEWIAVLVQGAELRRRLHRRQHVELPLRR